MNAIFSPCGLYRYRLERDLGRPGLTVAMIGVNPSIANDDRNDQTIRKDIGFGDRHAWGRLIKGNLFALVSTDIKGLRRLETGRDPINDDHLRQIMVDADLVVACWGPPSKVPSHLRPRWRTVAAISDAVGKPLHCLGTTKDGHPRHPLMTAYATPLTLWERPA